VGRRSGEWLKWLRERVRRLMVRLSLLLARLGVAEALWASGATMDQVIGRPLGAASMMNSVLGPAASELESAPICEREVSRSARSAPGLPGTCVSRRWARFMSA